MFLWKYDSHRLVPTQNKDVIGPSLELVIEINLVTYGGVVPPMPLIWVFVNLIKLES